MLPACREAQSTDPTSLIVESQRLLDEVSPPARSGNEISELLLLSHALLSDQPEPEPEYEADLQPHEPYQVDTEAVTELVNTRLPEVAAELRADGIEAATSVIAALPREVVGLMDDVGAFGGERTWKLLSEMGRNLEQGDDVDLETGPSEIQAFARKLNMPCTHEQADGIARFLQALPPNIRAAIPRSALVDDEAWSAGGVPSAGRCHP